jgi:tRNA (adenine57-N1/adenine58-N1)-methyltransferase
MAESVSHSISSFLEPGPRTAANSLAILQLSRDNLLPVYLKDSQGEHDGYAEGAVINTRYGSFPHSTLIGVPWGSQIRASKVDTGSRGRKRKRDGTQDDADNTPDERRPADDVDTDGIVVGAKQAVTASSGFIHILPPTAELWTMSLPHRTQVVYTPDYSYVLHRIRARPGMRLIEAGAGSGSFTHAAVRAVYNGYPRAAGDQRRRGKIFSFEAHEERFKKMKKELSGHGLDGLVQLTHRDVYNKGFLVDESSPEADAIFLDLPAPWEALPHLSRHDPRKKDEQDTPWISPLNPKNTVHVCTFSPCIEQVTRTVSTMRQLGWVNIEMVEICNRKIQVFRERIGLNIPAERGNNLSPANVEEALTRLTKIEARTRERSGPYVANSSAMDVDEPLLDEVAIDEPSVPSTYKSFMDGHLITRGEAEIKSHTSYLVFAILPREWTDEDEAAAAEKWPCGGEERVIGRMDKAGRREAMQQAVEANRKKKGNRKGKAKPRPTEVAG